MKNSIDSTRLHKETLHGKTSETQESHWSRNTFDNEMTRRGVSREEGRNCSRERNWRSERPRRAREINPGAHTLKPLHCESVAEALQLRSRSSTRSCATDASGATGSVLGKELEKPESEPPGILAVVDETEVHSGDGVTYVLAQATSRSGTEHARADLMTELVTRLVNDGIDDLIIKSRGTKSDERDRDVILDRLRGLPSCEFSYRWSSKREPLLWYADALAGASRDAVGDGTCARIAGVQSDHISPRVEWIAAEQTNA